MATWRNYDAMETACARVTSSVTEALALAEEVGGLEVDTEEVRVVSRMLNDSLRKLRHGVHDRIVAERGYRR